MKNSGHSLIGQALSKYILGAAMVGLLLFLPAGSFQYWNAWVLMGALFIPMLAAGIVMLVYSPDLLRKRLSSKEKEGEQKNVVGMAGLMFVAAFIIAGFDFRYGWTDMPSWIVWTATAVLILSYLMYAEVMRENAWLSRTIEVQDNQKVVDSGLYGIVRHPMYSATILLFLSMPVVLGSLPSLAVMLIYIPLINARIKNEEKVLTEGLEGYVEYKKKIRWKVIPFIW